MRFSESYGQEPRLPRGLMVFHSKVELQNNIISNNPITKLILFLLSTDPSPFTIPSIVASIGQVV